MLNIRHGRHLRAQSFLYIVPLLQGFMMGTPGSRTDEATPAAIISSSAQMLTEN
jgi:hypothetical protein